MIDRISIILVQHLVNFLFFLFINRPSIWIHEMFQGISLEIGNLIELSSCTCAHVSLCRFVMYVSERITVDRITLISSHHVEPPASVEFLQEFLSNGNRGCHSSLPASDID